jgi:8-oxo-dGTP pyrophosphatase MutT (NUDIX family)
MDSKKRQLPEFESGWKTLDSKEIHDNPWINLTHHDVIDPGGNSGGYGVVSFKHLAIGVLPLDEDYNTWLVGQYRYPIEQYSWEIPEGGGKPHVPPLETAKRELLEETGIRATEFRQLHELHLSNSTTDEFGILYVAQGLSFQESQPEPDEDLQVRKVPFQQAFEMMQNGEITDALSVVALYKVKHLIDTGAF